MPVGAVFQPSFGNRPSKIVGRERIIADLIDGLSTPPGHRNRADVIIGQRGMGKTALLLELSDRAANSDFVTARITAGVDMLDDLIETIQMNGAQFVKKKRTQVKGFNAGVMGFSMGLTFSDEIKENYGFRTKLSLLCDKLEENGKGILILVDEIQPNSDQMRSLATTYQYLVGEGKNIAIVMAGLPASVSGVLNDSILTFLNRSRKISLGPLSLEDVRAYYSSAFREIGKEFAPGALDASVNATEGFPYLLQLVGYYLVEYSDGQSVIDVPLVEEAIASSKRDLDKDVLATTLKPLSNTDIKFLLTMAKDEGPSKIADIKKRLGESDGYVQSYRARLLEAGVVASERRGELEFTMPYLKDYLRRM